MMKWVEFGLKFSVIMWGIDEHNVCFGLALSHKAIFSQCLICESYLFAIFIGNFAGRIMWLSGFKREGFEVLKINRI